MRTSVTASVAAGLIAGSSCLLAPGCAAPARVPDPSHYVFFSYYPELQRVSAPSGVFLYGNPSKPLGETVRFIVSPAHVGFQPQGGRWLAPAEAQRWADVLRDEIIASLSQSYEVVETPASDVLRVSLALTDIQLRTAPGDQPQFQPFLIIRISDSATGETVVLLRDLNRGHEFAAAAQEDETAARQVLREWAATLRTRLEVAQHHPAQPSESQL